MKNQPISVVLRTKPSETDILNKIASFFNLSSIKGILIINDHFPDRLDVSIPNIKIIQFLKFIPDWNDWNIEIIPKTY